MLKIYKTLSEYKEELQNLYLIKTHDSESQGQEEAAIICETKITRPLSELFTRKTDKEIANALD